MFYLYYLQLTGLLLLLLLLLLLSQILFNEKGDSQGEKLFKASDILKACNDMMIMIIESKLLSMIAFPPSRSDIYMTILVSRKMMMKMLLIMIIKMMISATQGINHPVFDNLASRAAPLSR